MKHKLFWQFCHVVITLLIWPMFSKAVPLHAMEAHGGRGDTAPTHSQPRH
jgi:hypothetical protein